MSNGRSGKGDFMGPIRRIENELRKLRKRARALGKRSKAAKTKSR